MSYQDFYEDKEIKDNKESKKSDVGAVIKNKRAIINSLIKKHDRFKKENAVYFKKITDAACKYKNFYFIDAFILNTLCKFDLNTLYAEQERSYSNGNVDLENIITSFVEEKEKQKSQPSRPSLVVATSLFATGNQEQALLERQAKQKKRYCDFQIKKLLDPIIHPIIEMITNNNQQEILKWLLNDEKLKELYIRELSESCNTMMMKSIDANVEIRDALGILKEWKDFLSTCGLEAWSVYEYSKAYAISS